MTPTLRLTTALRSLADALEGNGRHPLPCSDPEMPARYILCWLEEPLCAEDVRLLLRRVSLGTDAIDALCDAGLCDE